MSVNYGSKRIVTGAHYGLRDWLSQRVTAGLMALFTLVRAGTGDALQPGPDRLRQMGRHLRQRSG